MRPEGVKMIFKTVPYKYQEEAVANGLKSLYDYNFLALFGEVGTGKTKIAIDIFSNLRQSCNHLVVICPKGLFGTWTKEIRRHSDISESKIYRWDKIKNQHAARSNTIINMLALSGYVFIVNIEAFQCQNSLLDKLMVDLASKSAIVVLDESVKIQTPSAKRSKKAVGCMNRFMYRIIMTGTDISSGPAALYNQFLALNRTFWKTTGYSNYSVFKSCFTISKKVYIQGGRQIEAIKRMDEMSEIEKALQRTKLAHLNQIIRPYTIRILRKDCLDLPEQINVEVPIELSKEESKVYRDMLRDCIAEINGESFEAISAISVFTKLRQITSGHCNDNFIHSIPSKLSWLIDDIEDHSENAIVVAYFHNDVEIITEQLQKNGIDARSYYGKNSSKENEENKDLFEEGKLRILVASHDMIAQGHNLQEHCSLMYIYSVSLNSEVNAQFKGRIDRNGQRKNPVFKYILAQDTIDIKIHDMIEQKMDVQRVFSEMGKDRLISLIKGEQND